MRLHNHGTGPSAAPDVYVHTATPLTERSVARYSAAAATLRPLMRSVFGGGSSGGGATSARQWHRTGSQAQKYGPGGPGGSSGDAFAMHSRSANRGKGDGDTATWLPPAKAYRCTYVAAQVAVKKKYGLWVTAAEKAAIAKVNRLALENVVYAPTGFFLGYTAWRRNVSGIQKGPLPFFWGVSKT